MFKQKSRRPLGMRRWATPLALATAAMLVPGTGAGASPVAASARAAIMVPGDLANPTSALCKLKSYKIGYDVFSDSQPFAVSLSDGLKGAAKKVGCAQIVSTTDNMSGPTAIANLHTLINEGINGFVDFQVLAAYQPAMAKILKQAKIPAVTVVGATLPGFPQVGLDPYNTERDAAIAMANVAKKRFPGQVPYFLGGAEPESGAAVLARYEGAVAGIKSAYPGIPKSHIIEVDTDGLATQAYNKTLSALSAVPASGLVMVQAVNDEDTGGMFKAVQSRGFKNYLGESYGGDSYGLNQLCLYPTHYAGAWYLNPAGWGPVLLSIVMMEMNGQSVPQVTNIKGYQVSPGNPMLHCK